MSQSDIKSQGHKRNLPGIRQSSTAVSGARSKISQANSSAVSGKMSAGKGTLLGQKPKNSLIDDHLSKLNSLLEDEIKQENKLTQENLDLLDEG